MTSFASGFAKLLQGSLAAQLLGFAALPLLSRLYAPGEFGVMQAALSVLTVMLIVSSMRLEVALLTVADADLDELLRVAAWLCVATALLGGTVAALLAWAAPGWSAAQRTAGLLLPALGLLAGWNQLANYLCLRRQAFDAASNAKVAQAAGHAAVALGGGTLHPSFTTLMLADAVGRLLGTLFMLRRLGIRLRGLLRCPNLADVATQLRRYRNLTRIGLLAALVNAAGSAFTALMLLWLFSAEDAGQYAMVDRLVGLPIGLIVGAASQVFMSHLAHQLKQPADTAPALLRRVVAQQALWGALPALLLFAAGPWLVPLVLGAQWQRSGEFVQALVPLYFVAFAVGPVNMALTVLDRQALQFGWDLGRLAVMAAVWFLAWHFRLDALTALWLYSGASCLCQLTYLALADTALRASSAAPRVHTQPNP